MSETGVAALLTCEIGFGAFHVPRLVHSPWQEVEPDQGVAALLCAATR